MLIIVRNITYLNIIKFRAQKGIQYLLFVLLLLLVVLDPNIFKLKQIAI